MHPKHLELFQYLVAAPMALNLQMAGSFPWKLFLQVNIYFQIQSSERVSGGESFWILISWETFSGIHMVSQHVNSVHTYSLCMYFGEGCLFICLLGESKFRDNFVCQCLNALVKVFFTLFLSYGLTSVVIHSECVWWSVTMFLQALGSLLITTMPGFLYIQFCMCLNPSSGCWR